MSDEALASFDRAITINPLDPKGWNDKGVVLRDQKKYQEALNCFNKALILDSNNKAAQTNKELTLQDISQAESDDFYELDNILAASRRKMVMPNVQDI